MGLNQFPFEIETHQLAVFAEIDLLANIAGGDRVKSIAKTNMVIGMDFAESPLRGIESLFGQSNKSPLLLLLKNDPRLPARGPMDAHARCALTPLDRFLLDMLPIPKAFSFKEVLPDIRDLSFHGGFGVVRQLHRVRNTRSDFFG
jgi:hypothetical protein